MKLTLKTDFIAASRHAERQQQRVPFAIVLALTRTGQDIAKAERAQIDRVFDRPTRYTRNSVFLKPATKVSLETTVGLKDDTLTSGTPAAQYLRPQVFGGGRALKAFEARLVRIGVMRATERAVPAGGALIDAYGNMRQSQIVQILSQLRAFTEAGFDANRTNSRRSRAKRSRGTYFASGQQRQSFGSARHGSSSVRQHLPRGVWLRKPGLDGTDVVPVLLFVTTAQYRARFDFFDVAERTARERWPVNLSAAVAAAQR